MRILPAPLLPTPNLTGGEGTAEESGPEKQHASLPSEPHRTKPSSLPPPPRTRLEQNVPLPPDPSAELNHPLGALRVPNF